MIKDVVANDAGYTGIYISNSTPFSNYDYTLKGNTANDADDYGFYAQYDVKGAVIAPRTPALPTVTTSPASGADHHSRPSPVIRSIPSRSPPSALGATRIFVALWAFRSTPASVRGGLERRGLHVGGLDQLIEEPGGPASSGPSNAPVTVQRSK